jgi:hypothetical protein
MLIEHLLSFIKDVLSTLTNSMPRKTQPKYLALTLVSGARSKTTVKAGDTLLLRRNS